MKNYLARSNRDNNNIDFFDEAFNDFFRPVFYDEKPVSMKTDIKEVENGYLMQVELPGFDKKDINVSLENGYVTVSAAKREQNEENGKHNFIKKERSVSCERSYYVGDVKEEDIKAKYNNGVLELTVPKNDEKKLNSGRINIE